MFKLKSIDSWWGYDNIEIIYRSSSFSSYKFFFDVKLNYARRQFSDHILFD